MLVFLNPFPLVISSLVANSVKLDNFGINNRFGVLCHLDDKCMSTMFKAAPFDLPLVNVEFILIGRVMEGNC